MTSTTAELCAIFTRSRLQGKDLSVGNSSVTKNAASTRRSINNFVRNFLQSMANMFIPSVAQMNTWERNKQSISARDVIVDININIPIFDASDGKASLKIPEGNDTCDQTKTLFIQNSLFDLYSTRDDVYAIRNIGHKELGKYGNILKNVCYKSSTMNKESTTMTRKVINIPPECNNHTKMIHCNLQKDSFKQISDENKFRKSGLKNNNPVQNHLYEVRSSSIYLPPKNMISVFALSEKSFSSINSAIPKNKKKDLLGDDNQNLRSDGENESSIIIFSENVKLKTPSATNHPMRRDLDTTINSFFTPQVLQRRQRLRTLSESSDDSIVFCYESDYDETFCQNGTDLDSDDDSGDETEENSCKKDSEGTVSQQPDSGFEDRKVQFNLKPEVHVMRTWDFAYRQARKGEWEMAARDRERFKKRIRETEDVLSIVFEKNVRDRLYQERFN